MLALRVDIFKKKLTIVVPISMGIVYRIPKVLDSILITLNFRPPSFILPPNVMFTVFSLFRNFQKDRTMIT